ncbi:MAG TPA: TPM domain-containing protein, partial [Pseudonocardia sp.]|nr:TPM domain-containing protein [Pseudonocardia sp.]
MVVALLLLAGAGVAVADAPFRLADRVTDRAGVLDPAAKTRVQQAVDGLRAEKGYDLFVVYVRSFDGAQPQQWADR